MAHGVFIMKSGIYCIRNTATDQLYIGSAANVKKRWHAHRSQLNLGKHENDYLQRAWKKYGRDAFVFSVLEEVTSLLQLLEREQFWFGALPCHISKGGYNISPTAENCLGVRHTAETKAKLSKAKKGIPHSPEHCRKIGDAQKGKIIPEDQKKKVSEANKLRFKDNPELRRAVGDRFRGKRPPNCGKDMLPAQKLKISELAKVRYKTPDGLAHLARMRELSKTKSAKEKFSKAVIGRTFSAEHRRKLSEAHSKIPRARGWKHSEEWKKNHSAALSGRPRFDPRSPSDAEIENFKKLRGEGYSYSQIEQQTGRNRVLIWHYCTGKKR